MPPAINPTAITAPMMNIRDNRLSTIIALSVVPKITDEQPEQPDSSCQNSENEIEKQSEEPVLLLWRLADNELIASRPELHLAPFSEQFGGTG